MGSVFPSKLAKAHIVSGKTKRRRLWAIIGRSPIWCAVQPSEYSKPRLSYLSLSFPNSDLRRHPLIGPFVTIHGCLLIGWGTVPLFFRLQFCDTIHSFCHSLSCLRRGPALSPSQSCSPPTPCHVDRGFPATVSMKGD